MICEKCDRFPFSSLNRCKICFNDGDLDSDMCEGCKADHIEANEGLHNTEFDRVQYDIDRNTEVKYL